MRSLIRVLIAFAATVLRTHPKITLKITSPMQMIIVYLVARSSFFIFQNKHIYNRIYVTYYNYNTCTKEKILNKYKQMTPQGTESWDHFQMNIMSITIAKPAAKARAPRSLSCLRAI